MNITSQTTHGEDLQSKCLCFEKKFIQEQAFVISAKVLTKEA